MSRPASYSAFGHIMDSTGMADHHSTGLCNGVESLEALHSAAGVMVSHGFASAVGSSLSRGTTPEPQIIGRSLGSTLMPVGSKVGFVEKNVAGFSAQNGRSSSMTDLAEMVSSLSGMNLSNTRHADQDSVLKSNLKNEVDSRPEFLFRTLGNGNIIELSRQNEATANHHTMSSNEQANLLKRSSSLASLHSKVHSMGNVHQTRTGLPSMDNAGHVHGAYLVNPNLNAVYKNHLDIGLVLFSFQYSL